MSGQCEYIDQSASALRLSVVEGNLNKDQFNILTSASMDLGHIRVEGSIIGASHLITFDFYGVLFHEVFACIEVTSPGKRAFYGPLQDVQGSVDLIFARSISYRFEPEICNIIDGRNRLVEMGERVEEATGIGLLFEFPSDQTKDTPKTIVLVESQGEILRVESAHSYPNEGRVVFTETILACCKGA